MSVLCFPTVDAYRTALTTGAVPAGVAKAPATGAVDSTGRVWVERPPGLTAAALAQLEDAANPPVPLRPLVGWADLVPLQRCDRHPSGGPFLATGPPAEIARAAATVPVSRLWLPTANGPLVLGGHGRPAVVSDHVTVYWQQAERVWVPVGWKHPLPELLVAPPSYRLIARHAETWLVIADRSGYRSADGFRLSAHPLIHATGNRPATVSVRLSAGPRPRTDALDSFWLLSGSLQDHLRTLADEFPEPSLRRLALACVADPGGNHRVLLRLLKGPGRAQTSPPRRNDSYRTRHCPPSTSRPTVSCDRPHGLQRWPH